MTTVPGRAATVVELRRSIHPEAFLGRALAIKAERMVRRWSLSPRRMSLPVRRIAQSSHRGSVGRVTAPDRPGFHAQTVAAVQARAYRAAWIRRAA